MTDRLTELCEAYAGETGDACREIIALEDQLAQAHAQCWVPLALRAELVRAGDVIVGRDGKPMFCILDAWSIIPDSPRVTFEVQIGREVQAWTVKRDRPVNVLWPQCEHAALLEFRRQLGAKITDRTTGSES